MKVKFLFSFILMIILLKVNSQDSANIQCKIDSLNSIRQNQINTRNSLDNEIILIPDCPVLTN